MIDKMPETIHILAWRATDCAIMIIASDEDVRRAQLMYLPPPQADGAPGVSKLSGGYADDGIRE